jgi:hypothetical protein
MCGRKSYIMDTISSFVIVESLVLVELDFFVLLFLAFNKIQ